MNLHRQLCLIAANWLRRSCPMRCPVVFVEMTAQGAFEQPDAVGFTSGYSILVECKTSRRDFLADQNKFFRRHPEQGIGDYRFYLSPEGVIEPSDIPDKWGLLWANEKGKCRQVKRIIYSNILSADLNTENQFVEKNERAERALLFSAVRRICSDSPKLFYKY